MERGRKRNNYFPFVMVDFGCQLDRNVGYSAGKALFILNASVGTELVLPLLKENPDGFAFD